MDFHCSSYTYNIGEFILYLLYYIIVWTQANIGFFIMAIVIMKRHQDRRLSKTKATHTQAK